MGGGFCDAEPTYREDATASDLKIRRVKMPCVGGTSSSLRLRLLYDLRAALPWAGNLITEGSMIRLNACDAAHSNSWQSFYISCNPKLSRGNFQTRLATLVTMINHTPVFDLD